MGPPDKSQQPDSSYRSTRNHRNELPPSTEHARREREPVNSQNDFFRDPPNQYQSREPVDEQGDSIRRAQHPSPQQYQSWEPTDEQSNVRTRAEYPSPSEEAPNERLDDNLDITDSPGYYQEHHRRSHSSNYQRHVYQRTMSSVEEVTDETPGYFASFLIDRMKHDGKYIPEELVVQQKTVRRDVAKCLQQIGDDLSSNRRLNSLIGSMEVTSGTVFETFASVAAQIFEDGKINWGRIVTLFYFSYELAKQVLFDGSLVKTIIGWVVRFISERLAKWISDRGGWTAIREYFGSTPIQMVGVFVAGMVATWLVFHLKGK